MPTWLPSVPYAPAKEGYWSPITSTLNWCEEDYYATHYCAELVNTFTNAVFQYLAYRGIRNCIEEGHDKIFIITFLGYVLIGVGSFWFHMTLKYEWQLVDELSMIYTVALMFYTTFSWNQKQPVPRNLAIALLIMVISITAYYHYIQDPMFHQVTFGLLTVGVMARGVYITEVSIRPSAYRKSLEKDKRSGLTTRGALAEQDRQDERDARIVTQMEHMVATGVASFLGGFLLWNLDNTFCSTLQAWRHGIGLPWGILLEGHAWWHLMTGFGAYTWILWGIWLRHCLNGKHDDYRLHWPRWFSLPVILRTDSVVARRQKLDAAKSD